MFWSMSCTVDSSTEPHAHGVFELILCREGSGLIVIGDQTIDLTERRTILVAPDVRHRFVFRPGESAGLKFVCVAPDDIAAHLSPAQAAALRSMKTAGATFADHSEQGPPLWGLCEMIPDGLAIDDTAGQQLVWAVIAVLLAAHSTELILGEFGTERYRDEIAKVCAWIDDNLADPGDLDEIAGRFGMSRSLLTREFRRCTGTSVVEYINTRRLQNAGAILASSDASITRAAHDSGFSSVTNFYRKFKALYGLTPTEYRDQVAHV